MNGGLTYRDLERQKRKAKAFDEALEYLRGRASTEESQHVLQILERATKEK